MKFPKNKVLYIQPMSCEGAGLIEETRPDWTEPVMCRPLIGHPIPTDAGEYAAIIALGGIMGVYETDKYPWMKDLFALLRDGIEKEVPILGICLGSQALARAAGAEVAPSGLYEVGWAPIRITEEGKKDALFRGVPSPQEVFHWHGDRWELPEGAALLAASEMCDHQAFRIGKRAYGLQCHLEITAETPAIWTEAYEEDLKTMTGAPSRERILAQTAQHGPAMEKVGAGVFSCFWGIVEEYCAMEASKTQQGTR